MKKELIFLDYAATTPLDARVFRAMKPYFSEKFGNAGSLHVHGQDALKAIDIARETIASALGAEFRQIMFTGSATEANNLAIRGVLKKFFEHGRDVKPRIIISAIEHDSVYETAITLEREGVAEVVRIPVGECGIIDVEKFKTLLNERTVLVSIMFGNNEVGSVQPIREIAKVIEEFRVKNFSGGGVGYPLFHTDAVQSFQYLDCMVDELGVDFLTLSAHKIGGPKGIGALYVRDVKKIRPIITGGGQEFGFRSGTENVPSIVGFGKAVELAVKEREARVQYTQKIRALFLSELKKMYPRMRVHGSQKYALPHILNVQFPGVLAEMLLVALDTEGVAISTGSACSARGTSISHVLRAMGKEEGAIRESVRLSFCYSLSLQDVKKALSIFKKTLKNLGK